MEELAKEAKLEERKKEEYQAYIEEITPTHALPRQLLHAFVVGGAICLLGQNIQNWGMAQLDWSRKEAAIWCSISLILLADLFTGIGWYAKIVKWGGAGALVPITGFANSISAAAIEYKKEGWVFGVGCKIFTIAGPVLLYGIISSFLLGIIYYYLR